MSARSQAQRGWAFGVKGEAWARKHHYDNKGSLPKKAPKKRGRKQLREDINREEVIRAFQRRRRGK